MYIYTMVSAPFGLTIPSEEADSVLGASSRGKNGKKREDHLNFTDVFHLLSSNHTLVVNNTARGQQDRRHVHPFTDNCTHRKLHRVVDFMRLNLEFACPITCTELSCKNIT